MNPIYQLADWDLHFENRRSREIDHRDYVFVPNKQHGMGLTRILSRPDGAEIYGIFHLIVGALSQQRRPRNGWLTDDGKSTGFPWGSAELSEKFRVPQEKIQNALDVLSSQRIGWIRVVDSADDAPTARRERADEPPTDRRDAAETPPPRARHFTSLHYTREYSRSDENRGRAREVLDGINRHTEIVPRGFSAIPSNLKEILGRLSDGASVDDMLTIVEHRAREVARNPSARVYFNPKTMFRSANFERNLNFALASGPRAAAAGASGPPPDPNRERRLEKLAQEHEARCARAAAEREAGKIA